MLFDFALREPWIVSASLNGGSPRHTPPGRSNSAIDSTAARRASVRQAYSQRGRLGMLPGASLRKSGLCLPGAGIMGVPEVVAKKVLKNVITGDSKVSPGGPLVLHRRVS